MNGIRFGSLFGIPFYINPSWFIVCALVTWSEGLALANAFQLAGPLPWILGLMTAILMFSSVVLHELGHSLVAMRQGIEVKSITLFIFGGLASLAEESKTPGNAFWVAIAGPAVSFVLFGLCTLAQTNLTLPPPLLGILGLLAYVNLILGAFNLIPGLPLDGGNILKALVWKITGKPYRGVAFASRFGQIFGWSGVIIGLNAVFGNVLGRLLVQGVYFLSTRLDPNTALSNGFSYLLFIPRFLAVILQFGSIWTLFIGLFLLQNASRSAQTAVIQEELSGLTVADAMYTDSPIVQANQSVREFANRYLIGTSKIWKQYLVVDENQVLLGTLDPEKIKSIPTTQWWDVSIESLMQATTDFETVPVSESLLELVMQYAQQPMPSLIVQDGAKVIGVIEQASVAEMMQKRNA